MILTFTIYVPDLECIFVCVWSIYLVEIADLKSLCMEIRSGFSKLKSCRKSQTNTNPSFYWEVSEVMEAPLMSGGNGLYLLITSLKDCLFLGLFAIVDNHLV